MSKKIEPVENFRVSALIPPDSFARFEKLRKELRGSKVDLIVAMIEVCCRGTSKIRLATELEKLQAEKVDFRRREYRNLKESS